MERKWRELLACLPELRKAGVLDAVTAARVEGYALTRPEASTTPRSWGLYFLGSLGAFLIGAGVITLLASNWSVIPRWLQTVIAFIPLTVTGIAAAVFRAKNADRRPEVREVMGIFWTASIFEGVALVARIYQLPSDGIAFLGTSLALLLPVVYAMRSTGALLAFLVASLWGGALYFGSSSAFGLLFLLSPALLFPVIRELGGFFEDGEPTVLNLVWRWLLTIWLGMAAFFACFIFDFTPVTHWHLSLLVCTVLYTLGVCAVHPDEQRLAYRPLEALGFPALMLCSWFVLTLWRTTEGGIEVVMFIVFLLCICSICARSKGKRYAITAFLLPMAAMLMQNDNASSEMIFALSGVQALTGTILLMTALQSVRRLRANVGLLLVLAAGVICLAFTHDISLTVKGLSLIVAGLAFFALNFLWSRLNRGGVK